MRKKIAPVDNEANMPNPNDGTSGTNQQYDQAQLNRDRQLAEVEAKRQEVATGQQQAGGVSVQKTTGVVEQKALDAGQQKAKADDKK